MDTQSVVIGEIVLDSQCITLRAEVAGKLSSARIALLKYKLAFLLDTRFRPAPPKPTAEMTLDEVVALWHCHRSTVLRRVESGELYPVTDEDGELRFDRAEVEKLAGAVPGPK